MSENLHKRQDLMHSIANRLGDMGFEVHSPSLEDLLNTSAKLDLSAPKEMKAFIARTVPVYERRVGNRRVALARVQVEADGLPLPTSVVTIQGYQNGIHAVVLETDAQTFIAGLGPKPVTHALRYICAALNAA